MDEGDRTKPFFLYIAFNAPHFPLMAPQDEIAKFRGKYKIGWDRLRDSGMPGKSSWAWWTRHGRCRRARRRWRRGTISRRPSRTASITSWRFTRRSWRTWTAAVGRFVEALRERKAAGQHADPLPLRQRGQRRERPQRPARRQRARRDAVRSSSRGNRGRRSPTRRCAATSTSTTRAASPRR